MQSHRDKQTRRVFGNLRKIADNERRLTIDPRCEESPWGEFVQPPYWNEPQQDRRPSLWGHGDLVRAFMSGFGILLLAIAAIWIGATVSDILHSLIGP